MKSNLIYWFVLTLPFFNCFGINFDEAPLNSVKQFPLPQEMHYRSHPWHGISLGENAPEIVNCYIEIVPTDTVKYEMDKETGILRIDRPNKYACQCPTLYGFLPRTYAGERVGAYMSQKTGNQALYGDGDAIDICILTEKTISHGDIIVKAIPIGGFRMLDGNEADDKIVAVLEGDFLYGNLRDINDCPEKVIERLRHYFLTYKDDPERGVHSKIQIAEIYGREEALKVIKLGYDDYLDYIKPFCTEVPRPTE